MEEETVIEMLNDPISDFTVEHFTAPDGSKTLRVNGIVYDAVNGKAAFDAAFDKFVSAFDEMEEEDFMGGEPKVAAKPKATKAKAAPKEPKEEPIPLREQIGLNFEGEPPLPGIVAPEQDPQDPAVIHACQYCHRSPCITLELFAVEIYNEADKMKENGRENNHIRWNMYRMFTSQIQGYLGRGVRVALPKCVVSEIRDSFPEPEGKYVGFQAGDAVPDSDEE